MLRAMQEIGEFESVIAATGGAALAAVQCVEHRAADGGEGHCHARARREDGSTGGEWVTVGGSAGQLTAACEQLGLGVPTEQFDEANSSLFGHARIGHLCGPLSSLPRANFTNRTSAFLTVV
jgi:hypothetical protein